MKDGMESRRSWREIAEETSKERDSDKITELSNELIRALDRETEQSEPTQGTDEQRVRRKSA